MNDINKKIVIAFDKNHKYDEHIVIKTFWAIIIVLVILFITVIIIIICIKVLNKNSITPSGSTPSGNTPNGNILLYKKKKSNKLLYPKNDKINKTCLSNANKLWHTSAFFPRTAYSLSTHNNFFVKSNKSIISGSYLNNDGDIIDYTYQNARNCPSTINNYIVYSTILPNSINCEGGRVCAANICKLNEVQSKCNYTCISGINTSYGRCTTTKTAQNISPFIPIATCLDAVKLWKTSAFFPRTAYSVSTLNNYFIKSNNSVISGHYVGGSSTKFMYYTYKNAGNCPSYTASGYNRMHSTSIPETINCQGGSACATSGCTLNASNTGCNIKCITGLNTAHGFCTTTTKNNPMLHM